MNCLRPGHTDKRCSLSHCKYCKCRHNTLLHRDQFSEEHPGDNIALSSNMIASSSNANQDHVLLSTALAKMPDNTGRLHTVRLLLDNGSTSNFVTQDLCGKLGLLKRNTRSTVSGINDQISNTSESCNITLHSFSGGYHANVNCFVLPKITKSLPGSYVDVRHIAIPPGLQLADPTFNVPSAVDILVGAEVFWDVLGSESINLGSGKPKLQSSKLGWIISGCLQQSSSRAQPPVCHFLSHAESDQLTRFWELDSVLPSNCFSTEEEACETIFQETTRRDDNGQFVVTIPLKDSPESLGDSYAMAKRRFFSLERKLERDSKLKGRYMEFMREYSDLNHDTKFKIKQIRQQIRVFFATPWCRARIKYYYETTCSLRRLGRYHFRQVLQ